MNRLSMEEMEQAKSIINSELGEHVSSLVQTDTHIEFNFIDSDKKPLFLGLDILTDIDSFSSETEPFVDVSSIVNAYNEHYHSDLEKVCANYDEDNNENKEFHYAAFGVSVVVKDDSFKVACDDEEFFKKEVFEFISMHNSRQIDSDRNIIKACCQKGEILFFNDCSTVILGIDLSLKKELGRFDDGFNRSKLCSVTEELAIGIDELEDAFKRVPVGKAYETPKVISALEAGSLEMGEPQLSEMVDNPQSKPIPTLEEVLDQPQILHSEKVKTLAEKNYPLKEEKEKLKAELKVAKMELASLKKQLEVEVSSRKNLAKMSFKSDNIEYETEKALEIIKTHFHIDMIKIDVNDETITFTYIKQPDDLEYAIDVSLGKLVVGDKRPKIETRFDIIDLFAREATESYHNHEELTRKCGMYINIPSCKLKLTTTGSCYHPSDLVIDSFSGKSVDFYDKFKDKKVTLVDYLINALLFERSHVEMLNLMMNNARNDYGETFQKELEKNNELQFQLETVNERNVLLTEKLEQSEKRLSKSNSNNLNTADEFNEIIRDLYKSVDRAYNFTSASQKKENSSEVV